MKAQRQFKYIFNDFAFRIAIKAYHVSTNTKKIPIFVT